MSIYQFLTEERMSGRDYVASALIAEAVAERIRTCGKEMAPSWSLPACTGILTSYMVREFLHYDRGPLLAQRLGIDKSTYLFRLAQYNLLKLDRTWIVSLLISNWEYKYSNSDALGMVACNAEATGQIKFVSALLDNLKIVWDAYRFVLVPMRTADSDIRSQFGL